MITTPPAHWYQYEYPLPIVQNAPVPSKADYSAENVAPLIEMFSDMLGMTPDELILRYENNTPNNPDDDILVSHPLDKTYGVDPCSLEKSEEQKKYEAKAVTSQRLRVFQDNSPAEIKYFQDRC